MRRDHEDLRAILYQVLAEPIGMLFWANRPDAGARALYDVRKALGDPELDRLQIRRVEFPDGNIAIVKGPKK